MSASNAFLNPIPSALGQTKCKRNGSCWKSGTFSCLTGQFSFARPFSRFSLPPRKRCFLQASVLICLCQESVYLFISANETRRIRWRGSARDGAAAVRSHRPWGRIVVHATALLTSRARPTYAGFHSLLVGHLVLWSAPTPLHHQHKTHHRFRKNYFSSDIRSHKLGKKTMSLGFLRLCLTYTVLGTNACVFNFCAIHDRKTGRPVPSFAVCCLPEKEFSLVRRVRAPMFRWTSLTRPTTTKGVSTKSLIQMHSQGVKRFESQTTQFLETIQEGKMTLRVYITSPWMRYMCWE